MATINGTSDSETLKGGTGNDTITGLAGNDRALMGGGNDVFVWNVSDGNDTVEGGLGFDTLRFFSNDKDDMIALWRNGARAQVYSDAAGATLSLNDVERIELWARGGSDLIIVESLAGTDVKEVAVDLAGMTPGTGDGIADGINVYATSGNDVVSVGLVNNRVTVTGLAAQVTVANPDVNDTL